MSVRAVNQAGRLTVTMVGMLLGGFSVDHPYTYVWECADVRSTS